MYKLKCPECGEEDLLCTHEYRGVYDGWLELECRKCDKLFHRTAMEGIIESRQPKEYGPVYYKTKSGRTFRNLTEIDKNEYIKNNI